MPYRPFPNQERRNFLQTHLEIPVLLWAVPIPPNARLLEIGCGRGVGLARLAQLCAPARLVGVDIDPVLIDHARRRLERLDCNAELMVADARALPFEGAEFDVVVDFGTCYHIDHPEHALREVARVLRPEGLFVHETRLAQLLAHPVRARRHALPWNSVPALSPARHALLWSARRHVRIPSSPDATSSRGHLREVAHA